MTRDISPPVTAYQRKTGIYNTLGRLGQTRNAVVDRFISQIGQIIDFARSMGDLAIVKTETRE